MQPTRAGEGLAMSDTKLSERVEAVRRFSRF